MPVCKTNAKGKKVWYSRVTVDGVERRKKANSKREAKDNEVFLRKKLRIELASKSESQNIKTLQHLYEEYMNEQVSRGVSKNTINAKKLAFRRLFESVKNSMKVDELSRLVLNRHMQRVADTVSHNSANVDIRHVKAAYNWAISGDMIHCGNPCANLKPYRVDKKERHVPTLEEFKKALSVCEIAQDRLMLLAYFETGGRLREILNLKWIDVDLVNSSVRLWTGKRKGGREYDWVGISQALVELMREQQRETGFKEYVFISPKTKTRYYNRPKFFANISKRAGIPKFTAHEIRHLTATHLYHGGESLAVIQKKLRHTNSKTTDIYLHGLKGCAQSSVIASATAELLGRGADCIDQIGEGAR